MLCGPLFSCQKADFVIIAFLPIFPDVNPYTNLHFYSDKFWQSHSKRFLFGFLKLFAFFILFLPIDNNLTLPAIGKSWFRASNFAIFDNEHSCTKFWILNGEFLGKLNSNLFYLNHDLGIQMSYNVVTNQYSISSLFSKLTGVERHM